MKRFLFLSILCITFLYSSLASAGNVVYVKEYIYQASEIDSKASSRAIALELVKRQLLEELGTYLISETEVKDFKLSKDQITVLTAGIVSAEVLQEKWDGEKYYLKARISADPAEVTKSLDKLRKDREKSKELEDSNKKADEALREIERLKKEIGTLKVDKKTGGKYIEATNTLSAQEWFQKGYSLLNSSKNKDAINAFTKAIKIDPQFAEAYVNRGGAYFNLRNYQQAIKEVTRAIEINPQDAKAYNLRGGAYLSLRSYRQAIEDLDKAIEIDPQFATAYLNRGVSYSKLGNEQQAIADFKIAARLGDEKAQETLKAAGIDW